MLPADVTSAVQRIVVAVSSGEYETALAHTITSRCSSADIARTVRQYGRCFSAPPFADLDVVAIHADDGVARWSIRAPLWSEQEGGRSDLELFLTAAFVAGTASVEFDDIRVA